MGQKENIIQTYQKEEIVKTFDEERDAYDYQKFKHKVETNFIKSSIKEGDKVLDVACGTGRLAVEILKEKVNYYGIDTSKAMTDHLKNKLKKYGKQAKIIIGDAEKLPFKDNEFDVVFSYHLLWHLPKENQEKIIKEMIRVTKPEGKIVFDILNKNFIWENIKWIFGKSTDEGLSKLSRKEVEKIIEKRGYKLKYLSDAMIKNNFLYKIFNIINKMEFVLPMSLYHMVYFKLRK